MEEDYVDDVFIAAEDFLISEFRNPTIPTGEFHRQYLAQLADAAERITFDRERPQVPTTATVLMTTLGQA